jgi:hypothetical protein
MNNRHPSEDPALGAIFKQFDPVKLTHDVITLGEEWADKDAAASALEETKKTTLASIQLEYMDASRSSGLGEKPKAMPVSQAELKALSDPRYEQHLELMVLARKEANRSRVRYDMGKMRLELMRSLQATMRNEMRMSGNLT